VSRPSERAGFEFGRNDASPQRLVRVIKLMIALDRHVVAVYVRMRDVSLDELSRTVRIGTTGRQRVSDDVMIPREME